MNEALVWALIQAALKKLPHSGGVNLSWVWDAGGLVLHVRDLTGKPLLETRIHFPSEGGV